MAPDRYRAAQPGTIRATPLDTMTALYHRASGQTHIVASPVPELLDCLAEPASLDELLGRLSERYDVVDADPAALAARLAELVDAGLVERS